MSATLGITDRVHIRTCTVENTFILIKVLLKDFHLFLWQLQQRLAVDQSVLCSSHTPELEDGLDSIASGL